MYRPAVALYRHEITLTLESAKVAEPNTTFDSQLALCDLCCWRFDGGKMQSGSFSKAAAAVIFALLMSTQTFTSSASAADKSRVTVVYAGNLETLKVSKGLPWSGAASKFAESAISKQEKDYLAAISQLKKGGATQVKVKYGSVLLSGPAFADASNYVKSVKSWNLLGLGADGTVVGTSATFPKDPRDLANYLVVQNSQLCALQEAVWWNPTTWFISNRCGVNKISTDSYLRASLVTSLKKVSYDPGSWVVNQLEYALSIGKPKVVGDSLVSAELADVFAGTTNIPLKSSSLLGGYEIKIDLDTMRAVMTFSGPNLPAIARKASVLTGENYVRFF